MRNERGEEETVFKDTMFSDVRQKRKGTRVRLGYLLWKKENGFTRCILALPKSFIIGYNLAPDELIIKFKCVYTYKCLANDDWLFYVCMHFI